MATANGNIHNKESLRVWRANLGLPEPEEPSLPDKIGHAMDQAISEAAAAAHNSADTVVSAVKGGGISMFVAGLFCGVVLTIISRHF